MTAESFSEALAGRRVLVTGHTGFKGSWLSLWLHEMGARVTGVSREVLTSPSMFELIGLAELVDHRLADIRSPDAVTTIIDEVRPDLVFHLAAQPLVLRSYRDPVETFESNVMGTVHLLEAIRHQPDVRGVVVVTSDKVYRNEERTTGYVETDHLGGHDPYSASKAAAEMVAHAYHRSFLVDSPTGLATARAGNVIGGGDWAEDRIIADAVRAWTAGTSVEVRRPGATRPWQHVLDPVEGYLRLGSALLADRSEVDGGSFNFGPAAADQHTVANLLDTWSAHLPGASWISDPDADLAPAEATLLHLDSSLAHTVLGWRPRLDFRTAVAETATWYDAWRRGSDLRALTIDQIERHAGSTA
jgi:CDP-glucose 4,6-dehydratase